jgi:hypothetical protein
MRFVGLFPVVCVCAVSGAACAETSACPPEQRLVDGVCAPEPRSCETATTRSLPVGCVVSGPEGPVMLYSSWELTIDPGPIVSGEDFAPIVSATMSFDASILNAGLRLLGEFTRVEMLNVEGRITVRNAEAAEGNEVILKASIPMSCTYDEDGRLGIGAGHFPSCVADADCIATPAPDGPENRCGRFVDFDTDNDCDPGGVCDKLGEADAGSPCERFGFCAVGTVKLPLGPASGIYRAEGLGSVLFGWAEDVPLIESGIDRGAFDLLGERRDFPEEVRRSGVDVRIWPAVVSFECAMGVLSRGSDGPPTTNALLSPAPSGALISCPIQGP